MGALALLGALLPTVASYADPVAPPPGPALQVITEVSSVFGGIAAPLTARLNANAPAITTVSFRVETGPAKDTQKSCDVAQGARTCEVFIPASEKGDSLVRAWIGQQADYGDANKLDMTEPRVATARVTGLPILADTSGDDCQPEDVQTGVGGIVGYDDSICRPPGVAPSNGSYTEPDNTDVVQIAWTTFTDARLDCDDSNAADGEDFAYRKAPSERIEKYTCTATTLSGRPIDGAKIDGEKLDGSLGLTTAGGDTADFDNLCTTGATAPGQCQFDITLPDNGSNGSADICFWAEPGNDSDAVFKEDHDDLDGGGCDAEQVVETDNPPTDVTDAVTLDIDVPRASGLDLQKEVQVKGPNSNFIVEAKVFDQFGAPFPTPVPVEFEFFSGSPLDKDDNTPTTPDETCTTSDAGTCTKTWAQAELGLDLLCGWIVTPAAPAPTEAEMIGDNRDGSCAEEIPTDATGDDGAPFPVGDTLDIVKFMVQSRPSTFVATPTEDRQGATSVLRLVGANYDDGARISLSGSGVKVGTTRYGSPTQIEADVTVSADAAPGPRDVIVTNLDGGSGICPGCYSVIGQGYWLAASDGGIFNYGDTRFAGSTGDRKLNQPIVGMAATPSGKGYWLVASDGGIFAFGDAVYVGSAGNMGLTRPIVAMAATPSGQGYWLVGQDGGIFAFGDAKFWGSTGRLTLAKPIVGIAPTHTGKGYWLVGSDGGLFAFGDAKFLGGTGDLALNKPIVAIAPTKTSKGYWLVASDGGIFAYGDAFFYGGTGDIVLNQPIVGAAATPSGKGYWLVASDGGIFAFGDARFFGSTGNMKLNAPIKAFAARR